MRRSHDEQRALRQVHDRVPWRYDVHRGKMRIVSGAWRWGSRDAGRLEKLHRGGNFMTELLSWLGGTYPYRD
jgi:hypothetical protein